MWIAGSCTKHKRNASDGMDCRIKYKIYKVLRQFVQDVKWLCVYTIIFSLAICMSC